MRALRAMSSEAASSSQWLAAALAARASIVDAGRYIKQAFGDHQRGAVAGGGEHALAFRRIADVGGEALAAALGGDGRHDGILVVEHGWKIDFDPAQGRREVPDRQGRVSSPAPMLSTVAMPCADMVSGTSRSRKRLRTPIPKHIRSRPVRARAMAMPRLPANCAAKGSRINPSGRSVSMARQAAVISAVSLTWAISWASGCMVFILP